MNASGLLFKKTVDWTTLYWGITIPIPKHEKFHKYNHKKTELGTHNKITMIHEGQSFNAVIRNVNRKTYKDTLQIVYSQESEFLNLLKKTFRSTYQYVLTERARAMKKGKKKPNIKIPENIREYMEFHSTGKPFEYELHLIPLENNTFEPVQVEELKKEIKLIESDKIKYPFLPDIFSDLDDVSHGRLNNKKYVDKAASTLFEDLIFLAFYTLGYDEAKQLGYKMSGHKKGHPDGELKSHNTDYLIIYDAKERNKEYRMIEPDRRAMEDYVKKARVKNFKKIYCVIIASKFGDYPRSISGCPLTYLTARKLQQLISLKIQNPESVNPLSLEEFFSQGTLIVDDDLTNWIEEYGIKTFELNGILSSPSLGEFF